MHRCVKSVQIRSFFWSVFSIFGLNTEIYAVNFRIQSEYGKIGTRKNIVFGHFSRSASLRKYAADLFYLYLKTTVQLAYFFVISFPL